MLDYIELKTYFDLLDLSDRPVIVHASLKPFGYIRNGADAVLQAMLDSFKSLIMPTFTFWTKIIPESGPANNGIIYGTGGELNKQAVSYRQNIPVDKMMGSLPEALRNHPQAWRTSHPIFSFAGVNAESILGTQTLFEPLAPIKALAEQEGWVVLINVDHTSNTSIHYAEKLAGRRQFMRWALVGDRAAECHNCPGDSSGFQAFEPYIKPDVSSVEVQAGNAEPDAENIRSNGHGAKIPFIQAIPLNRLLEVAVDLIKTEPLALLCEREDCLECNAVRGIYAVG